MTRPVVVDSHLHVWDLSDGGYAWLGPQHGELYASFTAETAARELDAAGVTGAVLVQAEDSERDTRSMLEAADRFGFVAGVVGWVQLDDPGRTTDQLDRYGSHPAFRGVRHLVHDDPRDDFLDLPQVRESLALLARRGLPFDVPDAWPRHLDATARLAADLPDLRVVVDHLGKPPRGRDDLDAWAAALREVARRPNTVAKVSGLQIVGQPFTPAALRPVWDLALEAFGPARLMYGGDWPMTVPSGGYQPTWAVLSALVGELSAGEQAQVLGGTATTVYGLEVRDAV
ncbi:MAG TPA: amidohydrolase family protein [Nocardioidaceae bacterium]|nr:amidohydrolase family protein [Nocardioidaceae bacterium]